MSTHVAVEPDSLFSSSFAIWREFSEFVSKTQPFSSYFVFCVLMISKNSCFAGICYLVKSISDSLTVSACEHQDKNTSF